MSDDESSEWQIGLYFMAIAAVGAVIGAACWLLGMERDDWGMGIFIVAFMFVGGALMQVEEIVKRRWNLNQEQKVVLGFTAVSIYGFIVSGICWLSHLKVDYRAGMFSSVLTLFVAGGMYVWFRVNRRRYGR